MNGQKGIAIVVIAMVLTGSIGFFANMNEDWTTKTVYDKVTDLEGIIGQNAGTVDSYDVFNPLRNVTGWEGKNAHIPTTNTTTPYVINPYRNNYIWDTPVEFNMRSLTHTVGGAIFGPKDTLPFSDSAWATTKSGVTYEMYPVEGDETTAGRDAWIKYTDGTYVHGGKSATDESYQLSILPPIRLDAQTVNIKYYILGELQSKTVIFDTVSDLMTKIGKTLQNNQLISIDGGYLVFAGDLHATKTSQHEQNRLNNLVVAESNIFLDGAKSNVNTIKYNNGTYSGVNTLGGVEWESQAVYVVSTQSKITITVGTPIDGEPRYADPYELVTLEDSGYSLDEEPYSFTYNYTDNVYTTGVARTSATYQWYFIDELRVREINPIPHGNGSTYVTLSNGETMLWPDEFRKVWDESTESYITPYTLGIRGGILGSDFSYEDGNFDVRAKYPVSGQTSPTTSSSGRVMFIYSDDLLNKYIPSPQIGDVVTFGKNVSSSTGEIRVATNLRTDGTSGEVTVGFHVNSNLMVPYNVISYDYQIGGNYTSNPEKSVNLMDVKFTYTSDGWIMSDVFGTEYPRLTPRAYDSDSKGNLIFHTATDQLSSSNPPVVRINYVPANIVYFTTQNGVYLADFNETPLAYTDGTPWHGGYSVISSGTYPSVDYVIPDADGVDVSYDYVRWSNLEDVLRAQGGIKSLGSLVQIQLESIDTPTSKTILTTDISQTVTVGDSSYIVSMDSYRNRIVCDYLHTVINSQGVTIWEAYSGTDVVWSGELSELYLVQAQVGRIIPPATQIQTVLSGYAWDSNPGDDEKVVWWSNSVLNATVVNGSVSFLFMPQSTVSTELQVYTGDTLVLDATPLGNTYQLTYTLNDNEPVAIGEYVGLYVTYSVLDNTLSIQGVMSYENTKLYVLSPVVLTVPLEYTESLSYVYFITFFANWGAYVTETVISNDPLGYLWGDFDVNLDNYLSQYFPGLRVTIGGVVRYGDSLTINNVNLPVADGKFTYNEVQYDLRGLAIDYTEDNTVLLHVGSTDTLNLGSAQNHVISGAGAWYFSSGAFEINETKTKEYKWSPGWELSFSEMVVLFMIIILGMAIAFIKLEWVGDLDRFDIIVLGIAILISFVFLGGTR